MHYRNRICPYTCQPLENIDFNREHIVPDALGGPDGFCLAADRAHNSSYGSSIDVRLSGSALMGMLAARAGVKTRSGPATWRAQGRLVADGSAVELVGGKDTATFRFRKPVEVDQETQQVRVVKGFGPGLETELARVTKDLRRKGLALAPSEPEILGSDVKVGFEHNIAEAIQGLVKIAYLATVWAVGDGFIGTAAGAQYRRWLDTNPTSEALAATGLMPLDGSLFRVQGQHTQHDIACVVFGQMVLTGVRLFNEPMFEIAIAVDVPELQLQDGFGCLVTIDVVKKSFTERMLTP